MDTKQRAVHRLKIAKGHLDKVIKMVETDDYCIDVLTQSQAIQGALKEVDALILENHLQTCVSDAIRHNGKQKRQAVDEVIKVFRRAN